MYPAKATVINPIAVWPQSFTSFQTPVESPTLMPPNPNDTAMRIPPATTKGIMYETPLSSASFNLLPSRLISTSVTVLDESLADVLYECIRVLDNRVRGHRKRLLPVLFEPRRIGEAHIVREDDDVRPRNVAFGQTILDTQCPLDLDPRLPSIFLGSLFNRFSSHV